MAKILGKEEALFVMTGTMGNLLCILRFIFLIMGFRSTIKMVQTLEISGLKFLFQLVWTWRGGYLWPHESYQQIWTRKYLAVWWSSISNHSKWAWWSSRYQKYSKSRILFQRRFSFESNKRFYLFKVKVKVTVSMFQAFLECCSGMVLDSLIPSWTLSIVVFIF